MNIKQLEIFVTIAETGSFSKAAETAFITQSTASQHIASLENSAGVKLLDRTGRGSVLTEAGKILLKHALQVISAVQQTEKALRQFCNSESAELQIAGSTIPGTYLLPELVTDLRKLEPGITVCAEITDSRAALALLKNEAAEFAIVGTVPEDPEFEVETAGGDNLCLVVKPDHPWGLKRAIHQSELTAEYLIMREQGSGTGRLVEESLYGKGINISELKVGAVFSSSEAVKQAVLAGCGAAFISELAVCKEITCGELVAVDIAGIQMKRSFSLVCKRGRTLSPAAEKFRTALRGKCGAASGPGK
jgi:molybdate transport repressor ModE-like protein